jgi:hypothetical protein
MIEMKGEIEAARNRGVLSMPQIKVIFLLNFAV